MKSLKYILSGLSVLTAIYTNAQPVTIPWVYGGWTVNANYTATIVGTPNYNYSGVTVPILLWVSNDWVQATKDAMRADLEAAYPGIIFQSEATIKYNCHAWAWTGSTNFWMNTQPVSYFSSPDYSYVQVSTFALASKVYYGTTGDHSAITTSTANEVISKWGYGPRFRHTTNNCPYTPAPISYYAPNIIGPGAVYYNGTKYTLPATPHGIVTWEVTGPFSLSSATSNSVVVSKISTGSGTLTAKVGGIVIATKSITAYSTAISGPTRVYSGVSNISYELPNVSGAAYDWSCEGVLIQQSNGSYVALFNTPYPIGSPEYDRVMCTVTLNGVNSYFYINVEIVPY